MKISFVLNGRAIEMETDPRTRVIDILREDMHMTGTKEGCGAGDCGACTILVDGKNMLSCLMLAPQLEGRRIITIECPVESPSTMGQAFQPTGERTSFSGQAQAPLIVHHLQQAFIEYGAIQCGFCSPGMIMSATALLSDNHSPDRAEIRESISGNLCRCTGYQKIVDAVEGAARSINACIHPRMQEASVQDGSDSCLQVKESVSSETQGTSTERPKQKPRHNDFFLPETTDEIWQIFKEHPDAILYAGGTDLLVKLRASNSVCKAPLVCLERTEELKTIYESADYVFIGACCSHSRLLSDPLIRKSFPVLVKALKSLGSPQIRNMGTIGGNICTASPAGDTLPPLYVLDAEVEIHSEKKTTRIPIKDFIIGPAKTALETGEILYGIWIKHSAYDINHFEKVGQRRSLAISIASLAALIRTTETGIVEKARFAWGSVAPTVATSEDAEKALTGKELSEKTLKELMPMIEAALSPIDDVRAGSEYRRTVAGNLLFRLSW